MQKQESNKEEKIYPVDPVSSVVKDFDFTRHSDL